MIHQITHDFLKERPLSYSSLKEFIKSPQHYISYISQKKEQTEAMLIGSISHKLLLEPDDFENEFIIEPDNINRRTNEGKALVEKLTAEAEASGKTLISTSVYAKVKPMIESFIHSPNYAYIKRLKKKEQRFNFTHNDTGLPFIGYIDGEDDDFNVELKFMQSAEESDFARDAYNLKYHLQNAIYYSSNGKKTLYVVIEKTHPYCSRVFIASDDYTEAGLKEFDLAAKNFLYCIETESFELGYEFHHGFEPSVLQLPAWAKKGG